MFEAGFISKDRPPKEQSFGTSDPMYRQAIERHRYGQLTVADNSIWRPNAFLTLLPFGSLNHPHHLWDLFPERFATRHRRVR
jgi:hypothetical protein